MKEELYITFHSEDDIRHFVDTCNEFDDAIDIRIQKMAMDAKSLLGMLLMKTEEPLEIEYACYDDCRDNLRNSQSVFLIVLHFRKVLEILPDPYIYVVLMSC